MSAETLKTSLINLASFCDYLNENTEWAVNHADILALIAQERAEAVQEFLAKELDVRNFGAVPAVDPQKQRLDEFTRAILSGMCANPSYIGMLDSQMVFMVRLTALAQMEENDKP